MVGQIALWPIDAIPTGWLLCDGSSVLRATYLALFNVIGTAYGSVDGTHFNLPNTLDMWPAGGGNNYNIGDVVTGSINGPYSAETAVAGAVNKAIATSEPIPPSFAVAFIIQASPT